MRSDYPYCSILACEDDEKIYGTASRGKIWMLLAHPGPWGLKPPADTKLPEAVRHFLRDTLAAIPESRLLLIKDGALLNGPIAFYVAVVRETAPLLYRFALESYEDLQAIDLGRIVAGTPEVAHANLEPKPLFLVCTDGKHDKCCARYGLPIYRALKRHAPDATWQASHVGGDRFAANVVCFPHGAFYGHVAVEDIQPLVDACTRGHIYLKNFRGRSCYPFPIQAAEFFARSESGVTGLDDLYLVWRARLGDDTWQVEFASVHDHIRHRVVMSRYPSAFRNFLNCKAEQEQAVPQYRLLSYTG